MKLLVQSALVTVVVLGLATGLFADMAGSAAAASAAAADMADSPPGNGIIPRPTGSS
jgi:Na+/alanine symporter